MKTLEQRAQEAADKINSIASKEPMLSVEIAQIITHSFKDYQGANEKLREALSAAVNILEMEFDYRPDGYAGDEWDEIKQALPQPADESRKDSERLAHLFNEAYLPPLMEPFRVPPGTVVLCVASDVPLDEVGYREAIDAAMEKDRAALRKAGEL